MTNGEQTQAPVQKTYAQHYINSSKFPEAAEISDKLSARFIKFMQDTSYGEKAITVYQDFFEDHFLELRKATTITDFQRQLKELTDLTEGLKVRTVGRDELKRAKGAEAYAALSPEERNSLVGEYAQRAVKNAMGGGLEANVNAGAEA